MHDKKVTYSIIYLQKGKIARNWSLKSRKCTGNFISVSTCSSKIYNI